MDKLSVKLLVNRLLVLLWLGFASQSALSADMSKLLDIYRHLHANPDLSLQEENTARTLVGEMASLGFDVTEGVGGYGFVAVFKNGTGPTVLIRTDLDALPVEEQTGLAFASKARAVDSSGQDVPVMHACGHDIHMSSFIGTAHDLVARKSEWAGTLVMIGQPAEERGMGARLMLADGLYERFPLPDYNLALHVSAAHPSGTVVVVPGYAMANVDSVDIDVRGIGGHGAYPHTTRDPVVLAAAIIMNLQTIVSRQLSVLSPAVVTVGSIHGGTKHNIISDSVKLELTVRSYSDATRSKILSAIERTAANQARAMGWPEDLLPLIAVKDEYTPAVYNSPELASRLRAVFENRIGEENVSIGQPQMGGEDFSRYGRTGHRVPGLLFWLGSVEPGRFKKAQEYDEPLPSLHSPVFAPDAEQTIKTGVNLMSHAAIELFRQKP